jgi:GPH family glycoside/pentoside/hexuronide:cation symporter
MIDVAGRKTPRIGLGTRLIYGSGSLAFGAKDNGLQTILLIFYSQAVGVPVGLVSAAIAFVLVADAFIDPIVGQASDNLKTAWGRRHPFMYGAAIPLAITYFFLWLPPQGSHVLQMAYLAVVLMVSRSLISCYEIPSSALVAELTDNYHTRTTLLSFRYVFGWVGGLSMYLLAYNVFLINPQTHHLDLLYRPGYASYGLAAAILMVTAIFISAGGTHRLIPWLRKPPVENRNLKQLAGDMVSTLRHRSFLMMLGVGVFAAMGQGIGFTLNPYFVNYFWHLTPPQLSTLIIQAGVGAFGSTIVAAFVSRALGKKRAAMTLMASSVLIGAVPMTLRLLGLMPPNSTWELTWVLFAFGCVTSPMGIGASILVSSMIADVVEDSELRTGKRSEGLFFSAAAFVNKAISGMGVLGAGLILFAIAFPPHAAPGHVDAPILRNLALLYVPVTIGLYAVAITFMSFYKISKTTHEDNLRKLAEDELAAAEHLGEPEPVPRVGGL